VRPLGRPPPIRSSRPRTPLLVRAADQASSLGASAEAAGYLEAAASLEANTDAAAELWHRAAEVREASLVG